MSAQIRRLTGSSPKPLTSVTGHVATVTPIRRELSSGNGFGQRSLAARRMRDPLACYAEFPERWRDFLRATFVDAAEVAGFFRVSVKAAEKWWAGIGGAQGARVAYALEEIDGAADWLLEKRRVAA